jgi:hypothetical protein
LNEYAELLGDLSRDGKFTWIVKNPR